MAARGHEGIAGVTFASGGHLLVGVLYLARGSEPKPTALLLHGCPGLEQNLDLAAALRDAGWNALVFHYRGCWGSGGRYDLRTIIRDVRAAVDHLSAAGYPGVDPGRLAVAGHSLGGWAAILAASSDRRLRAVAACASPAALGALRLAPGDAEREFTRFLTVTPAELDRQRAALAGQPGPLDVLPGISPRPVLIVHGSADEWVPVGDGRSLYERARPPRRYTEIDGANHAFAWHRAALVRLVTGWLAGTGV